MQFKGRYITRNGTLVAVHINSGATPGNRIERYLGHSVGCNDKPPKVLSLVDARRIEAKIESEFKICWNENGEAVWLQGLVDDTSKYDLMEACLGDKWSWAREIRVSGCKECEG
jgi:hypothetical protein